MTQHVSTTQNAIDRLRKQARQLILNGLNEKLELNILHALVQERRRVQYKSYTFELNTNNLEDIQASTHKVSESDSRIFYLDLNIPSMNEPQQITFSENNILNALHEIGVPASAYNVDYKISKRESYLDTSSLSARMLYDIRLNPYHVQKIITIDLTQVSQDWIMTYKKRHRIGVIFYNPSPRFARANSFYYLKSF